MSYFDEMTRQQCLDAAARKDQECHDLEARYPGVRPGWVSCDTGMASAQADHYRAMAEDGRK